MDIGPRIDSYEWAGGREAMLRFGPDHGPIAILALPLFEEANRTRAFGIGILRALAEHGIGGVLPELPGQGESDRATAAMRLADLRAAFAAVPGSHGIAIRSGALVADERPCWMLAPQSADALIREIGRQLSAQERADHPDRAQLRRWGSAGLIPSRAADASCVAGNLVHDNFLGELSQIVLPGAGRGPAAMSHQELSTLPALARLDPGLRRGGSLARVVRLRSDPRPADGHVDGVPLWRRAEPDNDHTLAAIVADDIAQWIATCAG